MRKTIEPNRIEPKFACLDSVSIGHCTSAPNGLKPEQPTFVSIAKKAFGVSFCEKKIWTHVTYILHLHGSTNYSHQASMPLGLIFLSQILLGFYWFKPNNVANIWLWKILPINLSLYHRSYCISISHMIFWCSDFNNRG